MLHRTSIRKLWRREAQGLDVAAEPRSHLDELRPTLEAEQGQLRFLDARIEGLSAGLDQARPAVEEAQTRLARARGHLEP